MHSYFGGNETMPKDVGKKKIDDGPKGSRKEWKENEKETGDESDDSDDSDDKIELEEYH